LYELLEAGIEVTALGSDGSTALQQACVRCEEHTVGLLLRRGGWVRECGFACLLNAIRSGSSERLEVLQLLLAAAATAAGAAVTTAASAAGSSASGDTYCVRGTANGGYTLMHAAAAARSLSCAQLLLRHGADAAVSDAVPDHDSTSGLSPLDLLVLPCPALSMRPRKPPAELEPAVFEQFALVLLSCGATIKHSAMSSDQYTQFAGALRKHSERQQQQLRAAARSAALHACASWRHSDSNALRSSSSSNSSDSGSTTVQVQLVHAVTKQAGARVYTVNTKLLQQLYSSTAAAAAATVCVAGDSVSGTMKADTTAHTARHTATISTADELNSSSSSSSSSSSVSSVSDAAAQSLVQQNVLLKMLVPPEGWQSYPNELVLISYDGECVHA
jgi:hypothetical protein